MSAYVAVRSCFIYVLFLILQEGGDVVDSAVVAKHKIAKSANFASTCPSMVAQEGSRGHVLSALVRTW